MMMKMMMMMIMMMMMNMMKIKITITRSIFELGQACYSKFLSRLDMFFLGKAGQILIPKLDKN